MAQLDPRRAPVKLIPVALTLILLTIFMTASIRLIVSHVPAMAAATGQLADGMGKGLRDLQAAGAKIVRDEPCPEAKTAADRQVCSEMWAVRADRDTARYSAVNFWLVLIGTALLLAKSVYELVKWWRSRDDLDD